ncbi:GAF and ANTAR domain-containing protein [Williamsia muralis]|uniref:ANTAR domain-containing protein n=1 Tax=Williamsia marianensis TaxID=85044 RepID=A0A2G3PNN9_WILMA|nr:hypothetical protein CSW57_12190 [Williamsia marianensis]
MSEHMPADTTSALDELVGNAVAHIPGAAYAGITVVARRGEEITTPAATGEHPRTLDALQHKHHQGPCYAAATEHDSYFISDLHTEERWPAFRSDAMAHTPIRSIASFTLFTTRDTVGALNLYAVEPDAFGQQSRDLGYVFAAHAAVVWAALQRTEQFQSALASRDIIGQAKGMVMERYNLDAIQAFELLRRLSQDSNTRIFDIADRLVRADHPPSPGGLP